MAAYYICSGCKRQISMNSMSKARNGKCFSCHLKEQDRLKAEEAKNQAAEELVR